MKIEADEVLIEKEAGVEKERETMKGEGNAEIIKKKCLCRSCQETKAVMGPPRLSSFSAYLHHHPHISELDYTVQLRQVTHYN